MIIIGPGAHDPGILCQGDMWQAVCRNFDDRWRDDFWIKTIKNNIYICVCRSYGPAPQAVLLRLYLSR